MKHHDDDLSTLRMRNHDGRSAQCDTQLWLKGHLSLFGLRCNTPIGNTISGKVPFVGLIHTIMGEDRETATGPVSLHVQTQDALPGLAPEFRNEGFPKPLMRKAMRKMLLWKLTGKSRPNPFFDKDGQPVSKPEIINP